MKKTRKILTIFITFNSVGMLLFYYFFLASSSNRLAIKSQIDTHSVQIRQISIGTKDEQVKMINSTHQETTRTIIEKMPDNTVKFPPAKPLTGTGNKQDNKSSHNEIVTAAKEKTQEEKREANSPKMEAKDGNEGFTEEKNDILHPLFITNCSLLPRRIPDRMFNDLYEMLEELDRAFKKHNVTYVLMGGSLLGSYLFHDIVPWDDDIDLNTDQRDYERQMLAFQELVETGKYGVHSRTDGRNIYAEFQCGIQKRNFSAWRTIWNKGDTPLFLQAKFYKCSSPMARKPFQWRLPFIDVQLFVDNGTHVWERKVLKEYIPIKDFYPIHNRPVHRGWYPSMRNPRVFFKARYGVKQFKCEYYYYNHMEEKMTTNTKKVKCADIAYSCYPAVKRTRAGEGVIETLVYRNRSLHSVFIPESLEKDLEPLSFK